MATEIFIVTIIFIIGASQSEPHVVMEITSDMLWITVTCIMLL